MGGVMGFWIALQQRAYEALRREDEKAEEARAVKAEALAKSARYVESLGCDEFEYVYPAERGRNAT